MRHHPSLEEVLAEECSYEWLEINITGLFIGTFSDSENEKGDISSPDFYLYSDEVASEYGTFLFKKTITSIYLAKEDDIQKLRGDTPLGSINYYDKEAAFININITKKLYNSIIILLANNAKSFNFKIAIPSWNDKESKCLPLLKYQLSYEQSIQTS